MSGTSDNAGYYTEEGIGRDAPCSPGVYWIAQVHLETGQIKYIYVGQATDIRGRLVEHVRGESDQSECINYRLPDHFFYEVIHDPDARTFRERALIASLDPDCNRL